MAMRFREPRVLMASGNCDGLPSTVGFSKSNAFPPSGDFISRFAHSLMTRSVSTGTEMRLSSPALSRASMNCRNDAYAIGECIRCDASQKPHPRVAESDFQTPQSDSAGHLHLDLIAEISSSQSLRPDLLDLDVGYTARWRFQSAWPI